MLGYTLVGKHYFFLVGPKHVGDSWQFMSEFENDQVEGVWHSFCFIQIKVYAKMM